jgi:hypothetical protein
MQLIVQDWALLATAPTSAKDPRWRRHHPPSGWRRRQNRAAGRFTTARSTRRQPSPLGIIVGDGRFYPAGHTLGHGITVLGPSIAFRFVRNARSQPSTGPTWAMLVPATLRPTPAAVPENVLQRRTARSRRTSDPLRRARPGEHHYRPVTGDRESSPLLSRARSPPGRIELSSNRTPRSAHFARAIGPERKGHRRVDLSRARVTLSGATRMNCRSGSREDGRPRSASIQQLRGRRRAGRRD